MSKTIATIPIVLVAFSAAIGAAGEAAAETRSYNLSGFDRINVSAGVDVTLTQGPFAVKADERNGDFSKLVVEVRGNTLRVSRKNSWLNWNGPDYSVTISAPSYSEIGVSSGAALEGRNLSLEDLEVGVSSGANVELTGSCAGLRVDISSGAQFDGQGLRCETASVDASSGAHADAFATRSADGDASSGANVTFYGKPAEFTKDTSSGGSVRSF